MDTQRISYFGNFNVSRSYYILTDFEMKCLEILIASNENATHFALSDTSNRSRSSHAYEFSNEVIE